MTQDTIFISHSTHQDDYLAAWLAVKLKVIGYKAWVDLDDLSAGDAFNTIIDPIIKERSGVFIALTTRSYTSKAADQNSGVSKELSSAALVNVKQLGHNFILPARFDDIPYNDFPNQYNGWKAIDFNGNWQKGLIELVNELEKISFPKIEHEDPTAIWFKTVRAQNRPIEKVEKYYSNWFGFRLPDFVLIHKLIGVSSKELYLIPYPLTPEADRIITFASKPAIEKSSLVETSHRIAIKEFFNNDKIVCEDGFILMDPRKKLIRLLNNAFQQNLRNKALICWVRGSSKTKEFYFRHHDSNKMVNLKRYGKPLGRRALTGQVTEDIKGSKQQVNWAFSLTASADIDPVPHYKVSYGLVFSDKNFKRFGKAIHHKLRRSIPSDWFNRKWFETLLAAVLKVSPSPESEHMEIEVDDGVVMKICNEPFSGTSLIGYIEPDDIPE